MSSRHWEKLWHDIIDDIKLGPLPAELKWRFVQLIVVAGIAGEGGLLPDLPDRVRGALASLGLPGATHRGA